MKLLTRLSKYMNLHPVRTVFFCIALFYLLTIKSFIGNPDFSQSETQKELQNNPPFETSMERGRYMQVISLAEKQTFTVDSFSKFLSPDVAWSNGHYYPAFPPGVSFLSVPGYLIGKVVGLSHFFTVGTTSVASILCAYFVYLIARKLAISQPAALLASLLFSLASVAFAYSVSISAHPFSALILCICLYAFLHIQKGHKPFRYLAISILAFGATLFIDYPNLVIFFPIVFLSFVGVLHIQKVDGTLDIQIPLFRILLASLLFLFPLFLFFGYNSIHYGKYIAFSNTYNLKRLDIQGIPYTKDTLTNDVFLQKKYAGRFQISRVAKGARILLVSHDRGVFVYSPVLVFSLLGFYVLWKENRTFAVASLLTTIVAVCTYGAFDDPWGGWGFGPRYMIVILPIFALLTALAYDRVLKHFLALRVVFLLLFSYSIGVNLVGALTTSAVPPSVEAIGLGLQDNFILNINYLLHSTIPTRAVFYTHAFGKVVSPVAYASAILVMSSLLVLWVQKREHAQ